MVARPLPGGSGGSGWMAGTLPQMLLNLLLKVSSALETSPKKVGVANIVVVVASDRMTVCGEVGVVVVVVVVPGGQVEPPGWSWS